jgi:hypothetical protein
MAEAVIHELPEGVGQEQYDAVSEKLAQGDPPEGLVAHFAGQGPNGRWRIVEVWESRDQWDRFSEDQLTPAISEVAQAAGAEIQDADHTWWSLHTVRTG